MHASATYLPKSDFHRDLNARVDEYFSKTASGEKTTRSRKGGPAMWAKTAIILAWLTASYVALVFVVDTTAAAIAAAVSLGLAMAGVGFNIQHDGNLGAYSERPWVNHMMALTLDLLGGTAYYWHYKHNIAHHTHPNVDGHDDDIQIGPVARMSPHQRWYPLHRFQHFYVWILYGFLAIEWQLTGEFRNFFSKDRYGQTKVPRPNGRESVIFWVGKVVFFTLAFGIPLWRHSVGAVIGLYLVAAGTLGLVLAVVFQVAHCSQEADFRQVTVADPTVPRGWAEHQVETTVDFAQGSRFLCWYLGGLNFQIEHHLYPKVSHVHYPHLAPIVRQTCAEHGVRYRSHEGFMPAIASHWRLLRTLGSSPAAGTISVASVTGADFPPAPEHNAPQAQSS